MKNTYLVLCFFGVTDGLFFSSNRTLFTQSSANWEPSPYQQCLTPHWQMCGLLFGPDFSFLFSYFIVYIFQASNYFGGNIFF